MDRSTPTSRILTLTLAVGLVFLLPACGAFGGNGDDEEGKFPEPPDRPNSAHVVTPVPSPGAPGSLSGFTAYRG